MAVIVTNMPLLEVFQKRSPVFLIFNVKTAVTKFENFSGVSEGVEFNYVPPIILYYITLITLHYITLHYIT